MLTLSLATEDDAPAIAALRRAVAEQLTRDHGPGHWSSTVAEEGVRRALRTPQVYVARDRGGVVATGTLVIGNQLFDWANTGFWTSAWGFSRAGGPPVVQFQPKFTLLRRATDVVVDTSAWALPELPLLVTLGWYMMVSMADDSGAMTMMMGD